MVSPTSIVIPTVIVTVAVNPSPCTSGVTPSTRGVTAGASTSLGIVAGIVGVNVGIDPSTLYLDSAMEMVAHSDRQAGKNLIVDLRAVSRPSAGWLEALEEKQRRDGRRGRITTQQHGPASFLSFLQSLHPARLGNNAAGSNCNIIARSQSVSPEPELSCKLRHRRWGLVEASQ